MSTTDDVESALPRGWRITYTGIQTTDSYGRTTDDGRKFHLYRYEKVRTESPGAWFRTKVTEEWKWVEQHAIVSSKRNDDGLSARADLVKFALSQLDAEEFAREEERQQELQRNLFPEN